MRTIAGLALALTLSSSAVEQVRLTDEFDRAAFRSWFVWLAESQFDRPSPDVTDCAALVRHAFREALRSHTTEWLRHHATTGAPTFPDVRTPPRASGISWPLFRTASGALAEFADAQTIVRFNARSIGRDADAARPGDLLYFHQQSARSPHHLMVYIGPSTFDDAQPASDWIVYHTGPDDEGAGEMRKARLMTLRQHPSPRWRPRRDNPSFVGVFRLSILEAGGAR